MALSAAVLGAAAGETAIERALAALVRSLPGLTICHMAVVGIAPVEESPVPVVAAGA